MKKGKNFLLIEHGGDQRLEIQGIIGGKRVHVHISGEMINYYEDTDEHLEVKITKGLK